MKDNEADLYKNWWAGSNVHFSREPADALGKFLGRHVAKLIGVDLKTTESN